MNEKQKTSEAFGSKNAAEATDYRSQRRRILTLLIVATLVNILGTTIYLPSMPAMARSLSTDMATVQGFLTAYLIASACGQLVLGPLSDAYGRRVILLPALAGFAVLSFAAAATTHVAMLFGLRLLQGLCGCACVIITRAVIRDINTRTGTARDMAAILLVVSLMPPVSQTLGGLLADHASWRAPFLVMGVMAVAACLLALVWLPETVQRRGTSDPLPVYFSNYGLLLKSSLFGAYCAMNALLFSGLYFLYAALPPVLIEWFGVTPSFYGPLTFASSLGMLLGSTFSNRTAEAFGVQRLLTLGTLVSALAGVVMLALQLALLLTLPNLLTVIFVWFIGYGILLPNTIASAMSVRPDIAGAGAALLGFLQIAAGALGSSAATFFVGPSGITSFMAALAFVNLVLHAAITLRWRES